MDAAIESPLRLPGAGRVEFGQADTSTISMKWSALHEAAGIVAGLAGLNCEAQQAAEPDFPAEMRDIGGWRLELARQGIDDLSAIMEAGLAALLGLHARGGVPSAPALALWQEFEAARAALLALLPAPIRSPAG